ncbi:MAG: hypothetical protein IIA85_00840 [Nanoarchaeota archaeon]|nr:hypothetical protein [Nanoarchaeota archaeon]
MPSQNLDSNISEQKRKFILLEFTKELIRQSGGEIFRLEDILEGEDEDEEVKAEKKLVKANEKRSPEKIKISKKDDNLFKQKPMLFAKPTIYPIRRPVLFIPKPKLPQRFNYLRPVPTNLEIDLGKLNSLINDPLVKNIECNGPGQNIVITGTMGRKKTNIFLSKEEINEIIKKISETTKIPIHEGIFRAVAGKLIFSAIISDLLGSKFTIKKMTYSPRFR